MAANHTNRENDAQDGNGAPLMNFTWGQFDGTDAGHAIHAAYAEVVHWRRNIFKIPWGVAGKDFVRETSRLLRAFAEKSSLAPVAMKALMLFPSPALQRPSGGSRAKDNAEHLSRRMRA